MNITRMLAKVAPPAAVRWLGRLQFKVPALAPLINRLGASATSGEQTIRHGIGRGLKFDSRGGHPGYAMGTSDVEEQDALAKNLRPGGVFYDIGANVGFFTTLAGKLVGPEGRVWGFEPFPSSAQTARDNAARNGFDHVRIIEAAVSNYEGEATFDVSKTITNFSLSKSNAVLTEGKSIKVPVVAIDSKVKAGLKPPQLVMIDVEGAELEVLEGMKETIAGHRPTIICEVHWIEPERFRQRFNEIAGEGTYQIAELCGRELPNAAERYHLLMTPRQQARSVCSVPGSPDEQ